MREVLENQMLSNQVFIEETIHGDFDLCIFDGCDFTESNIEETGYYKCKFKNCNFSNAHIKKSSFTDCEFEDCKLLGMQFDLCHTFIYSIVFKNCDFQYSSLVNLKLRKCKFTNCKMRECDFAETDFTEAEFHNCDFAGSHFDRTILTKADLSTSKNFLIDPENNKIKKAVFSQYALEGLLYKYDLILRE